MSAEPDSQSTREPLFFLNTGETFRPGVVSGALPAYHLPGLTLPSTQEFRTLTFGEEDATIRLAVPVLAPIQITQLTNALLKARVEILARRSVYEIVAALDTVIARWYDRAYPYRQQAEMLLPVITGYHHRMVREGLDDLLAGFTRAKLLHWLEEELGDPSYLDEFRPRPRVGGRSRAFGPTLTAHIFSGNVPGLPLVSLAIALLVKSASLGKTALEEPLFPVLFARSLAEVDAELARCLGVTWWPGGSYELEAAAFAQAEAVVAFGSEMAVQSIGARVPANVRFVGHGHKLSFGAVAREYLVADEDQQESLAHLAALDVSGYDQQGCLSPHVFYVERGGLLTPREFAALLAREMSQVEGRVGRGRITREEEIAIAQIRRKSEFQASLGISDVYTSAQGTAWTVLYSEDPEFQPSCLNRTIWVKPVESLDDIPALIAPFSRYLQTAGVAASGERLTRLATVLGSLGVDRVCLLGRMGHPALAWHHDGRAPILELLRWTDIELGQQGWL